MSLHSKTKSHYCVNAPYFKRDKQSAATLLRPVRYLNVTENSCKANAHHWHLWVRIQSNTAMDYDPNVR